MSETDLRNLAIDRGGTGTSRVTPRRRWLTRYAFPLVMLSGFLSLVAWAARDVIVPATRVTVASVVTRTGTPSQKGTPLFKAAGWIEPRPTPVRVAALAPGVVEKLLVVEDQPVKTGDAIAELIRDDAELEHQKTLAQLQLREAELNEAEAVFAAADKMFQHPVHRQAELKAAEAALARIRTELRNLPFQLRRARADHEALRQDFEGKASARNVIPEIKIEIAKGKSAAAEAMVAELQDRAVSLKAEEAALADRRDAVNKQRELLVDETQARDQAKAQIEAATARLSQARIAVAEAQLRLDRMTIVAPVDGRVYRLIAHPGTQIGSGMTLVHGHDASTVITMYRPDMLQVRVDTRFEDIPKVALGQPVEISNPALSTSLTGRVLFISSEADIQKNTLQVKVEIPQPPAVLKPEMLVDITFLSSESGADDSAVNSTTRIYVPDRLVQTDSAGAFVWVADQSTGTATYVPIEINNNAPTQDGLIEVTSGLNTTSRLITSATDHLINGSRVSIQSEDSTIGISLN